MIPENIKILIESFKLLPGIGEKTAERLAFSILDLDEEQVEVFSDSVLDAYKKTTRCKKCNCITDSEFCKICSNEVRDDTILCVVEDSKSVFLFEKLAVCNGYYHVLNGLISPLEGIDPEDIGLSKLIERLENSNYREIILAFKPSIEGETTALYINKILDGMDIKVTKIASGIPMGADIEYMDALTIERALLDRKNM